MSQEAGQPKRNCDCVLYTVLFVDQHAFASSTSERTGFRGRGGSDRHISQSEPLKPSSFKERYLYQKAENPGHGGLIIM